MNKPYRVYRQRQWPKPKKHFYQEQFGKRQQARQFCRHRSWEEDLIVHPDGTEEAYN